MKGNSKIETHQGSMILHAADRYPTLLEVILEQIQNALDVVGATHVWVTINKKKRRISVSDNGEGTSQSNFEMALRSVGRTVKSADKMGRFGLGLVSPVGKCEYHTFTSTSKLDPRKYIKWTFVATDIRAQREPVIPFESDTNLQFSSVQDGGRSGKVQSVPWRTKVDIVNYTNDRFISRLSMEMLAEQIRGRFNVSMLKDKSVVHLTIRGENEEQHMDIEPVEFQGTRLPVVETLSGDTKTTFRLYLARKTSKGRDGKVAVGERYNDFRIPFSTFVKNLPEGARISSEAAAALQSGVFEGEILNNRVRVHSSRRCFEENDRLLEFCVAVDQWFKEVGNHHFEDTRDTESAERNQDRARRTLQVVKGLRESPAGSWLNDLIDRFKFGTRGDGHTENKPSTNDLVEKGISAGKPTLVSTNRPTTTTPRNPRIPRVEIEGHSPNIAFGPKGRKRHVVRDNSVGIGIAHEALGGTDLWAFDDKFGIVTFNTEHQLWSQCHDKSEKTLSRYEEWLFLQACFVQSLQGRDWQETIRIGIHELAASYVFTLCHGDILSERTPVRKAQEARRKTSANSPKASEKSLVFKRA